MQLEGVIKFHSDHDGSPLVAARYGEFACRLIAWREIMALTGLVGQETGLYDGAGYGNVSCRVPPYTSGRGRRSFLITGTQTSGRRCIGLDGFCLVKRYDYRTNRVESQGSSLPSSESMTHAAVYDLGPHIRTVLHAHSPVLWRHAAALRIPTTEPSVAYGTPEMASEVQRLYGEGLFAERKILSMGGHEDGIVTFGRSTQEAGEVLLRWLAKAYELSCGVADSQLCSRD